MWVLAIGCAGSGSVQTTKTADGPVDDTGSAATTCPTWYADDDGDGFGDPDRAKVSCDELPGRVHNAKDCDDSDPTHFPGALWPADADGDGFTGDATQEACLPDWDTSRGGDCDDGRDDTFPGAPEQWYDGVDQNCDGSSDYDQDLDGADSDGYGGKDCDDTDPDVHRGATEVFDWRDTDCDGTGDQESARKAATFTVSESELYDSVGEFRFSGGDLDGDGIVDLVVPGKQDYAPGRATWGGQVAVFAGPLVGDHVVEDAEALIYATDADHTYLGYDTRVREDTDGDGVPELWITSPAFDDAYYYDTQSSVCRFQAPFTAVVDYFDDALGCITSTERGPYAIDPVRDQDGDGLPDTWLLSDEVYLWTRTVVGQTDLADGYQAKILGYADSVAGGLDFDGDGVDDVAVGYAWEDDSPTGVFLGPHSGVIPSQSADVEIQGDGGRGMGVGLIAAGDLDGDGVDDLVIADRDPGNFYDPGKIWVAPGGTATGTVDLEVSALARIDSTGYSQFGDAVAADDLDGDGAVDLVVGAPGDDEVAVFFGPILGNRTARGADLLVDTPDYRDGLGITVGAFGDLDGDGRRDVVVGSDGDVLHDVFGTMFVIPGP